MTRRALFIKAALLVAAVCAIAGLRAAALLTYGGEDDYQLHELALAELFPVVVLAMATLVFRRPLLRSGLIVVLVAEIAWGAVTLVRPRLLDLLLALMPSALQLWVALRPLLRAWMRPKRERNRALVRF